MNGSRDIANLNVKKEKDVDIEEEIVIKEEKKTKMKKMVDGIKEVIKPTKNKK